MIRVLVFILFFGFVLQNTGATGFLKETLIKTEQCTDNTQENEGKTSEETKAEKDQIGFYQGFALYRNGVKFFITHIEQSYPTFFNSKPFLPPRI